MYSKLNILITCLKYFFLFKEEEQRYGPFSDGEAETLKRAPRFQRRTRGGNYPHYATMSRQANGAPQMDNIVPGGPAVVGGPVVSGFPRRAASVAGGRYSSQPQLCSSTEQLDMFPDTGTDASQILYFLPT